MSKKKFPSIFAYSANTIGLRSLWHLDELFLTKFPLKWCIECICSLSGSWNIYKNVFSVILQFLRICNFFHEKKRKKTCQMAASHFSRWRPRKDVIRVQFFMNWTTKKIAIESHCEKWLAAVWRVFFFFFSREKRYKFKKIAIWGKKHFYRYFGNQISYRYIRYIILKEI